MPLYQNSYISIKPFFLDVLITLSERFINCPLDDMSVLLAGQCDWTDSGISLCSAITEENMPLLSDYHQHFDVVFVDATRYHNLCYAMEKTMFMRVGLMLDKFSKFSSSK